MLTRPSRSIRTLAHAYAVRGWLKNQKGPWSAVAKEFESDMRLALALDPSLYSAHAGLITYFAGMGQWAELAAEIDRAVRDNPTNTLVLMTAATQLPYMGRPEEGVAMADLVLRLDPQMPGSWRRSLAFPYFFARKFERVVELTDQIPEESRDKFNRFLRAASYAFLGRAEDAVRAKADLIAKDGEQVMEMWFNDGEVFARTSEQDIEREAFRKLGFRICATEGELKKFDNPKRLPECVKT
jgi:tetratricopeptide (TPR) repeat protein